MGNGDKLFIKLFGSINYFSYICMKLLKHTNMIYAIYLLKNPITNQVVYVGKTSDLDLDHYLKSKYWKRL